MTKLIVKANKLNKRIAVPANLPDPSGIIGVVEAGFTFEGTRIDPAEYPNPDMGSWYQDRDGYVYWGGGLEAMDLPLLLEAAPDIAYPWWLRNQVYSIPDLWDNDPNPKVRIAILDTGINQHVDFNFNRITGYNYLENNINYKTDQHGHGTHLAGIMIAGGKKSFGVFPSSELFVAKVCDNDGVPKEKAVEQALHDILHEQNGAAGIDIINMSFHLQTGIEQAISNLITQLVEVKNCLVVGACGDDDAIFHSYPACLDQCISVGSINANFTRWLDSTKSNTLDIMAPGVDIVSSSGNNSTVQLSGTSQSAAFISGIIGIAIQWMKNNGGVNSAVIKKALFQTALNNGYPLHEYGHGIINPNEFIKTLKSM